MITVPACHKNVMTIVERRKSMEVNMVFWRQHSSKLDGLSFPPSLVNCHWPLPNCCICYLVSPSHITWVSNGFFIWTLFYILVTLQLNSLECDTTISIYCILHEEASESRLNFRSLLSKQSVLDGEVQKTSFDGYWVPTHKFGPWFAILHYFARSSDSQ